MRALLVLVATGMALGCATLRYGGVLSADWNPCVIALGAILLLGYFPAGRDSVSAPVSPLLYVGLFAIPLWALLQTIPMPAAWVAILSPERAQLAKALLRFDPNASWIPLSIRPEATLEYSLRYLAFAATFLITRDLMWRMPERRWLLAIPPLVIAGLEAGIGLLQDASGVANVPVSGTFVNRDHFSALLEMCLPFAAGAVFIFAPRGIRAVAACCGAVMTALLFAAIAASLSRAGFFTALLSLLLLTWAHVLIRLRGPKRLLALGASVVVALGAAVVLASGSLLDRLGSPGTRDFAWTDRLLFWQEAWHVVAAYPVFGCGFGGFGSAVTPFRAAAVEKTLDYAHNDYLQFLAEGGIVGFVFAVIVCAFVLLAVWRGVNRRSPIVHRGFAIASGVALFAGILHSAVDLITYVPATGMLLCWIAGMGAGLDFDRRDRYVSG